jgi:hypothetical protein
VGVIFGLAWLLNPVVQNANLFEFTFGLKHVFYFLGILLLSTKKNWYFYNHHHSGDADQGGCKPNHIMFGLLALIDKRSPNGK